MRSFFKWMAEDSDNVMLFFMMCLFVGLPVFFGIGYWTLRLAEMLLLHK